MKRAVTALQESRRRWATPLLVATNALMVSCGPNTRGQQPNSPVANADRPVVASAPIELIEAVDLPTMQILRRKGDPHAELGLSIFVPGGSVSSLALTELLHARLDRRGIPVDFRSNAAAVLAIVPFSRTSSSRTTLLALHDALHAPVVEDEVTTLPLDRHFGWLQDRASLQESEVGLCGARLGAEGIEAVRSAIPAGKRITWLERIRSEAVVAGRIGISAVGEGPLLDEVKTLHQLPWEPGAPVDDSWMGGTRVASLASEGGREIRIALRISESEQALAAARALRQPGHPARARLRGFSSRFEMSAVDVTLRPAGACLQTSIVVDSDGTSPSADQLASAALLVSEELEGAAAQTLSDEERSLALVEPQTIQETAALAAWAAVRSPLTGSQTARLIEYRGFEQAGVPNGELLAALTKTEDEWNAQTIPVLVRDEQGQSQLHMMLASPCGTQGEPAEETGLRALTVHSLARQFSGQRGVQLVPFVHPDSIGLIAHSTRMRGETPVEHAQRAARALASALSGADMDGRAIAEARTAQLDRIGSDPGVALIHSIFGGEARSALYPLGNENVVSSLSTYDVERSREELAQEPIRLAVLANEDAGQGQSAATSVARWLSSERKHVRPCVALDATPADPGQWTLETLEENVSSGAYVGVWAPVRPEVGHALVFQLAQHENLLSAASPHAPPPPPPGGSVDGSTGADPKTHSGAVELLWQGSSRGGALVARVGAGEEEQLEELVERVRLGLHSMSVEELSEDDIAALQHEFSRRAAAVAARPMGRLIRLWLDRPQMAPTARELKLLISRLRGEQHRVVLVKRRK